jgi:anti-sigma regulatory factor (Ser/Thr protein kinase)
MRILELSIPPQPRFAATVRAAFTTFAGVNRLEPPDAENLIFALGEAIANAIQHAQTLEAIQVRAYINGNTVVVTVIDRGRGFAPPQGRVPLPSVYAEAGRGFAIMQRCTDFLEVFSRPGTGTAVKLGRYRRDREELAS